MAGVIPSSREIKESTNMKIAVAGTGYFLGTLQRVFERDTGFKPGASLEDGLRAFTKWYREYCKVGA